MFRRASVRGGGRRHVDGLWSPKKLGAYFRKWGGGVVGVAFTQRYC